MKWPPSICWTAPRTIKGNRHFQVKRFGGKKKNRWVELFATKDENELIRISWEELKLEWKSNWLLLPKDDE